MSPVAFCGTQRMAFPTGLLIVLTGGAFGLGIEMITASLIRDDSQLEQRKQLTPAADTNRPAPART